MPDGADTPTIRVHPLIARVDAAEWDACAGDASPFVRHGFLSALEDSRSACAASGWQPRHLTLEDPQGRVLGCAPLYLKTHSYGEYIFDWGWADAYERAGGRYYPKLQGCVPFTPATGPRLLVRPDVPDQAATRRMLAGGIAELARRLDVSSAHVTFCTEGETAAMEDAGYLHRVTQQYHWHNRGYADFDDFLSTLSSRKRKTIRKEREKANAQGVEFRVLSGETLEARHMEAFHRFYLDTVDRKWAHAYLTPEFFRLLHERMADRVALVMGFHGDAPVCGALNFIGADALYGRNWGADPAWGQAPFLHFEACYYRAIDIAIERGLSRVEAGAQGEHKISRGYLPVEIHSAHWIADPALEQAVARFLRHETAQVSFAGQVLTERGPYRRDG